MTTETETLDPVGPVAGNDEVTDAEYEAWQKGEELPAEPAVEEAAEPVAEPEATEEPAEPEEPAGEGDPEPEGATPKKDQTPEWARKRFSTLAQQRDAAAQRAADAEARAAAAEALLAAQGVKPEGEEGAAPKDRVYTKAELDAEAARQAKDIAAQTAFDTQCNTLFATGAQEFGEDAFDANLQTLRDVGVISAADLSFVQDALETESPAKVLYHLGQNPDEAIKIAGLSATKRAVALDRLAAKLATPVPKVPKPISKVPAPIAPVGSARGVKEIDINDPNLTDEEAYAAHEAADRRRAGVAY